MSIRRHAFNTAVISLGTALALSNPAVGDAQRPDKSPTIRVTPSQLFTGELKRLEPHLGLTNGCVKLDYSGPDGTDLVLNQQIEIWKNGKRDHKIMDSRFRIHQPRELTITLKKQPGSKDLEKYEIVVVEWEDSGNSASTVDAEMPTLKADLKVRAPKPLREAIEITEGEPVAVWGFVAGGGANESIEAESIEETAKRVECAIILKIGWKKGRL